MQISAGEFSTCGITANEQLKCWGMDVRAEGYGFGFVQVAVGSYHFCAIRQSGSVECWGTFLSSSEGRLDPLCAWNVQGRCGVRLATPTHVRSPVRRRLELVWRGIAARRRVRAGRGGT